MGFSCRRPPRSVFPLVLTVAFALVCSAQTSAPKKRAAGSSTPKVSVEQEKTPKPPADDALQRHYTAAQTFQLAGDAEHASAEYKAFLTEALRRIGNARTNAGEYDDAERVFQEGFAVAPNDAGLKLDHADLLLQQGKLDEAKAEAETVAQASPNEAKAHELLGNILYSQGDLKGAKEQLETAIVAAPNFDLGYLLGVVYIKLGDLRRAGLLFDEMLAGYGDKPQLHVYFARAYREGQYFDQTVEQLKKALAKDPALPSVHYLLALAYLSRDGESGFPNAIPELKAEIKNNPKDARSYFMLGYIELKQHDAKQAEADLLKSTELDPKSPDPYVYLAQLYMENNRPQDSEAAARKAIELTTDVSRNQYQVNRAHYILARMLLSSGRREEADKELKISQELRNHPNREAQAAGKLADAPNLGDAPAEKSVKREVSEEQRKKSEAYVAELKPSVADAYNNLGVNAAAKSDFAGALAYFHAAREYNPALDKIDRNLGMAAFYANKYDKAVEPLQAHLQVHPDDLRARAALGLSLFSVQKFGAARQTLAPIEKDVDADPGLSYAYAVSLVKTGEYAKGVDRLQAIEKSNPNSADIHVLLGDAYADQGIYAKAREEYEAALKANPSQENVHRLLGLVLVHEGKPAEAATELEAALKLNPNDVTAKYHLAYSLIEMQQKDQAVPLLREVIQQDPKHADAYYQLGKLQLDGGDAKAAIPSLETASKLSPDADYIHYQLAQAYRRDSRTDDAKREMELYQTLKDRRRGGHESQPN